MMSAATELKIVFTGPMGAGKTTAIGAISDFPPVSTDVGNNDRASVDKESTTVGLDLGQLALEDGTIVRLYGTPGQERFAFMWEIVGTGAIGVILLLDGSSPNMITDLCTYADAFSRIAPGQPFVIGLGRTGAADERSRESCVRALDAMSFPAPVFTVDVRRREDVLLLIEALLSTLEMRTTETANDGG